MLQVKLLLYLRYSVLDMEIKTDYMEINEKGNCRYKENKAMKTKRDVAPSLAILVDTCHRLYWQTIRFAYNDKRMDQFNAYFVHFNVE